MTGPAAPRRRTASRALVPVLLSTGVVVAAISSLGAPLVPAIAAANGVSLPDAQWALTVTLLVGAVATPVLGRLGDGPRRRAVVLTVLGVVVAGSVLAALPLGLGWLITGRGLQGLGLGLTPVAIAIARDALPGPRARATQAALSIMVAAGVGVGYPLAGLVAGAGGVHAAFWAGAAVSGAALAAAALVLPPSPAVPARRLDVVGALLLGTGLAAGVLALSEAEVLGWTSPRLALLAGVCVAALAAWVAWALRTPSPVVDLRLARGRTAGTAHSAALLVGLANYLLLSSVPLLAQTPTSTGYGAGASIGVAGLVLLPFSVASVLAGRLARLLADRAGIRAVVPVGAVVIAAAHALYALTGGGLWQLCVVMTVAGLGVGAAFAALPALVVSAVPAGETGSAMSLNQVLRYVGFAVGSATTATVLEAATPPGAGYPVAGGYAVIGLIGCAIGLLTAAVTWVLPARAPTAPTTEPASSGR
ncbi:MFS transporter [Geodermatophilus sp. TF02-6]|uniref:MFS transporter n=1 Tax=Geodermatophilus sp. TF02-6 TaxID=2250575 RepID=UPI000DEB619F|nr:MFS transporter [Geodermatophilus sp. TF02-6]RBY82924.1 MFS transporter [Geodermatophilus sp. TF02-6]